MKTKLLSVLLLAALALTASATDYYMLGSDSGNNCPLDGRGSPMGWGATSGGTQINGAYGKSATDPNGIYHIDGLDFTYENQNEATRGVLRGALANTSVDYTFQGGQLVFDGYCPVVQSRMNTGKKLTIDNLLVVSGSYGEFRPGQANTSKLDGNNWVVETGAILGLNAGDNGTRGYDCYATITGNGVFAACAGMYEDRGARSNGAVADGTITLYGDLSGFTGVLNAGLPGNTWFKGSNNGYNAIKGLKLVIANPSALPVATANNAIMRGGMVVTNGATLSFTCSATSPAIRGWDFGSGAVPTINVAAGCTVTVFGPVQGTVGFKKTGDGTLIFNVGGEGAYDTITLTGARTVSAATLSAYVEKCEQWILDQAATAETIYMMFE